VPKSTLPAELVSLVHHIQLNEAGWWDSCVQRLIEAAFWLGKEPLSATEIIAKVGDAFHVTLRSEQVGEQLAALVEGGTVVASGPERFKLSESSLQTFATQLASAEAIEGRARERFAAAAASCCPNVGADELWTAFHERLLLPTVAQTGARTYELVAGGFHDLDNAVTLQDFLQTVPASERDAVRKAVATFLDPADVDVRAYVLRHMNAYFVIEASELSQQTVHALTKLSGQQPSFTVFADTNFIFSVLGMHAEAANEAARQLVNLVASIAPNVRGKLYIAPPTVDEARAAIEMERDALADVRWTPKLALAALESGSLGDVGRRFAAACVKADRAVRPAEYFAPFVGNLVQVLRAAGVEVYNESFDRFEADPTVGRDVKQQLAVQERAGWRQKSRAQVWHDVVLWHFVHGKRAPRVDSPLDAKFWLLTEDFRLIGFDQHKRRKSPGDVPVCVHPLALVQMLQFWVGRTPELESALLGTLRLSFLFQPFDANAERVTLRILEHLSLYEDVQALPQSVITSTLLDRAIRQRIESRTENGGEGALIRDALIQEYQRVAEAHAATSAERDRLAVEKADAERLRREAESTGASASREVSRLTGEVAVREEALKQARSVLEAERRSNEALASEVATMRTTLEQMTQRDADREVLATARASVRSFVVRSVMLGITLLALVSSGTAWELHHYRRLVGMSWWKLAFAISLAITFLWLRSIERKGLSDPAIAAWPPFKRFHRAHRWIYTVLLVGVGIKLLTDLLKSLAGP
jgi:hypothetical protein